MAAHIRRTLKSEILRIPAPEIEYDPVLAEHTLRFIDGIDGAGIPFFVKGAGEVDIYQRVLQFFADGFRLIVFTVQDAHRLMIDRTVVLLRFLDEKLFGRIGRVKRKPPRAVLSHGGSDYTQCRYLTYNVLLQSHTVSFFKIR